MDDDIEFLSLCATAVTVIATIAKRQRKRNNNSSRVQPKYHRACLIHPSSSLTTTAWQQVLACGSSSDFIVSINFDRRTFFDVLLPLFTCERPQVNNGSPYRKSNSTRGRKSLLQSVDILGLALWYLKSSDRQYKQSIIFGLVPTSISVWIDYGLEVLMRIVKNKRHDALSIKWPSHTEMKESSELLKLNRENGQYLNNVFGVVDGGRMPCADYTDVDMQNAYYEGYTTNVEVTNLLVYNFKGELIHAALNFPGSWHDSRVANMSGFIYPLLYEDDITPPGMAILCDSAFLSGREIKGKLIRARKSNEVTEMFESEELAAIDIILQRVMPSERQAAEWGVRALKAPFGILRLPLSPDSEYRGRLLQLCAHLLNMRTRLVGLNQIRTVYASPEEVCQPWAVRFAEEQNAVDLQ